MTKLPPNAYRTTINGNPYIVHEDGKGNVLRLEDDYDAKLAKLNIPQRIKMRKSTKTRFAKPGENKELRKA